MKTMLIVGVLLALPLGGCATTALNSFANETPEQRIAMVNALANAGCKGTITVRAGAGTAAGVSPGHAEGSFDFTGSCDPNAALRLPPPTPIQ